MPKGQEDLMHQRFARIIRQYQAYNKLNCRWWSYNASGEKRSLITGSLLKSKGLNPGAADYEFITTKEDGYDHNIFLEFKRPKSKGKIAGKLGDNQVAFQEQFANSKNSRYYVAYSEDEGLKVLEQEKILR